MEDIKKKVIFLQPLADYKLLEVSEDLLAKIKKGG